MGTPHPLLSLSFALAGLAGLAAAPARAEEPAPVQLEVGESKPLGGSAARCDDLAIVSVTLGPDAVVTGLKVGETVCSVAVNHLGGARLVYQVKVVEPPAPARKAPGRKAKQPR